MENKNYELANKQLEKVSAGAENEEINTLMLCDFCSYKIEWAGDYMNGKYYDCPKCKQHSFHGYEYC